MKKRIIPIVALMAILGIGAISTTLSSCKKNDPDTGEITEEKLTITVNGETKVGNTLTLVVKNSSGSIVTGATLTIKEGNNLVELKGAKLTLKAEGKVVIEATSGEAKGSVEINILAADPLNYITVKEAKSKENRTPVTVRGVITATSGTSAYLSDGEDSIFIYNWYFNQTDTACENFKWVVGKTVEIYGYVIKDSSRPVQLAGSYKEGETYHDLEGRYANAVTPEITPYEPIELTETAYNTLNKEQDAGKMYTFNATYESGVPTTDKAQNVKFKLGSSQVTLRTDGSSSKMYDKYIDELVTNFTALDLKAGDNVRITAPLSYYNNDLQFSYFSKGVSIIKEQLPLPESFTINSELTTLKINEKTELTATLPEGTAGEVTYEIVEGDAFITLENNVVTGIAAGNAKIKGKIGELYSTNEITITVTNEVITTPLDEAEEISVEELLTKEISNKIYKVKGVVTGASSSDQYGNTIVFDKETKKSFATYGISKDTTAFNFREGKTSYENPKTFNTEVLDKLLENGDEVELYVFVDPQWDGGPAVYKTAFSKIITEKENIKSYTVELPSDQKYLIASKSSELTFGEEVTLSVNSAQLPEGKVIKTVKHNDQELAKEADGTYKFNTEVVNTITIELKDENEVTTSIEFKVDDLNPNSNSYIESEKEVVAKGINLSLFQIGNYGDGIQMRIKNGNAHILSTTATEFDIESITIVSSKTKAWAKGAQLSIQFGTTSLTTAIGGSTISGTDMQVFETEKTINCSIEGAKYFAIEQSVKGAIYIESIIVDLKAPAATTK